MFPEIENYLSDLECANLIDLAWTTGLFPSTVIGGKIEITDQNGLVQRNAETTSTVDIKNITRVSEQSWLYDSVTDQKNEIIARLMNR